MQELDVAIPGAIDLQVAIFHSATSNQLQLLHDPRVLE